MDTQEIRDGLESVILLHLGSDNRNVYVQLAAYNASDEEFNLPSLRQRLLAVLEELLATLVASDVLHNDVGISLSTILSLLSKPLSICIGNRANALPIIGLLEDFHDLALVSLDRSAEVFSGSTRKQIHQDRRDTAIVTHVVAAGERGGIILLFQRGAS